MTPLRWPFLPARWRARCAYVAPLLVGASIFAPYQPVRTPSFERFTSDPATQPGVTGRYMLRSVNGQPLPAILPSDDPQHTLQVTSGLLELHPDGSYLCRTVATDIHLGLQESFADTLIGGYAVLAPGRIEIDHKGFKPDTIVTSGFQVAWPHPVRSFQGLFLYGK